MARKKAVKEPESLKEFERFVDEYVQEHGVDPTALASYDKVRLHYVGGTTEVCFYSHTADGLHYYSKANSAGQPFKASFPRHNVVKVEKL